MMRRSIAGFLAVGLVSAAVAGAAEIHARQGTELLKAEYVAKSRAEVRNGAQDVDQALELIYQNLRTLASLPGIRNIDRHAETLTPETRTTFQMIYNNLANSFAVSEVYITPADFDPDLVDPVTGHGEEPIVMFDELILNAGSGLSADERIADPNAVAEAASNGPPEVEIFEYRLLREQAAWFREHYPDNSAISGLRVPLVSGPEVITCDNTFYLASRSDPDRKGIIFSVPFFDESGNFQGMVSAIVLTRALTALLPDANYALVNAHHGYVTTKPDAPAHVRDNMPEIAKAAPVQHLIFSEVAPISLNDKSSTWAVWAGYDDNLFYDSPEYVALQNLRWYGFGLAAVLLLAGLISWFFVTRDVRKSRLAAIRLARARDDARVAEAEARELASKFQDLNEDIGRLNKELTEKVQMLQEAQNEIVRKGKMAQLGQLTATIAHELRNPMGSVRTTTFLMRRKAGDQLPHLAPLLTRIENGISRCDDIITQLLDFARSKTPDFVAVELDHWLVETIEEDARTLPETVAIECSLGLGQTKVMMDPGRVRRVLINLLSNACEAMVGKATSPAAVVTQNPTIRLSSRMTERGIEITVTDNGPGMDAETLAKIREPLFTTKNFGTGLGIPAVERILELHGGGLDIHSEPGKGATFVAWFPAQLPAQQAA